MFNCVWESHLDLCHVFIWNFTLSFFFQITTSSKTTLCSRLPWRLRGSSWRTSEQFQLNTLVPSQYRCLLLLRHVTRLSVFMSCLCLHRVTPEDLLPTRLLWVPSLRTPAHSVSTKNKVTVWTMVPDLGSVVLSQKKRNLYMNWKQTGVRMKKMKVTWS